MQVSTSAFYVWAKTPASTAQKAQQKQLEMKALELFEKNKKTYGSRRLSEAFKKEGIEVGRFKAGRLMTLLGLEVRYPKRFKVTTDSHHQAAISPNLLNREFDFHTSQICSRWKVLSMMTIDQVPLDWFFRPVVGGSIHDHLRASRCVNALQMAFGRRKPEPGLLQAANMQAWRIAAT